MVTYKEAGVDIDAGEKAVELMKKFVKETYSSNVIKGVGGFGGLFEIDGKVLVSSADGVGTKLKLAFAGKHDTVGQDLVNHCVNDILVQGAKPLFFMDYFAIGKLVPEVAADVVKGFSKACKENGCVLLGGETAELPGIYKENEYDLAGFIVGIVDKDKVIDGSRVKVGDKVIGLPSSGLHTNGYSLALNVLGDEDREELMKIHISYLKPVMSVIEKVNGMAHITGGGLVGNIPRVLPEGTSVKINKDAWDVPKIFKKIQEKGDVPEEDMWRTFNMGIGYVLIVDVEDADFVADKTNGIVIGEVVKGEKKVVLD